MFARCACSHHVDEDIRPWDGIAGPSEGPVDVSSLTRAADNDLGLLQQPAHPTHHCALVEVTVRSAPFGGSDKSSNGHRYDTIPIANGMITAGMSCQLLHYFHEEHDSFFEHLRRFDAVIVRCYPGQIGADGGDQARFDGGLRQLRLKGVQVWPAPDVVATMGAKDALCRISALGIGLPDTTAYSTEQELASGFRRTIAFQPRVIKQNRGSAGEGIWIVKLKSGNYCRKLGEFQCSDDAELVLVEASDNHVEEHTLGEFIEFCVNGHTAKSGHWASKGAGKYLSGQKPAGGPLVDQRFCPRIVEGELRYNMVGGTPVGITRRKPRDGNVSAVGGAGSTWSHHTPDDPQFRRLSASFLGCDLCRVMPALGLMDEPLPLWWTVDFILSSPIGTPTDEEQWIAAEFNCNCVGIQNCQRACCSDSSPRACFSDIGAGDVGECTLMGNLMGDYGLAILRSQSPVDVSRLARVAKDSAGLCMQPMEPKYKCAIVQVFVRGSPHGGPDKSASGHRYDTLPIANGMIRAGMSCQLLHYVHEGHFHFFQCCRKFDAIILRCNPGQIKADGGNQRKFDDSMRELQKQGVQVWPSPDAAGRMSARDALCRVKHLSIGLEDTLAYYTEREFSEGFRRTMAFQPRVIKQNRGSSGEGIWIVKLKNLNYCRSYGARSCSDKEELLLQEANDNHTEEHTVAEFIEFCVNGRTAASGTWASTGVGKYLEGGKAAGSQLVDQRFCPRIVEGELRYNMVGDSLVGIIHKKPKDGAVSAGGGTGFVYTFYGPEEPKFQHLTSNFLQRDLAQVMPALGLPDEPMPLWWTTDFILASPMGTKPSEEKWVVGEFNCSCVGISRCLAACSTEGNPSAGYSSIEPQDLAEANRTGDLMGQKGLAILDRRPPRPELVDLSPLTRVARDDNGLLPQPARPHFKCGLVQIYVRDAPFGGSDKSSSGHRYDTIPIANGMIKAGMSCQLLHYVHEEHDQFFEVCNDFKAVIVRCNPGQIKADGGDQGAFDAGMRKLRTSGVQVWPSPDVVEQMGAKDALCKIASLKIGLEHTRAYYTESELTDGLKKSVAFEPRVLKQNRGSSGEGIWIVKLKSGDYCGAYGERACGDDTVLLLTEANDNHCEEHTVAEFVEFCVRGRTDKAGAWSSAGAGRYLEGGREAGGQIVDQRFCPRIVEGEVRYNMVGDTLVGIIHKKPKEGGISAVGGTGSVYTYYEPGELRFQTLTSNFLKDDIRKVMPALGLHQEPIPLWWTTDFILASPEGTPSDQEKWIVGEFNCSCVGVSRCLAACCKDAAPHASFDDISEEDLAEATRVGDLMGETALDTLDCRNTHLC